MSKGSHTPNTPKKMPSIPTGPNAKVKGSPSKVMKPMGKAGTTAPEGKMKGNSAKVNPKSSSQTVDGGPKR